MSATTMAAGTGRLVGRRVRGFFAAWRLVLRISAANLGGRLQYRGDFLTTLAMGLAWQTSVFVFVSVILTRFPSLGGWSASDVLLILAIRMLAHGVVVTVFNSLLLTPYIAQQGLVDFYLVRPMPVYRQVLLYQFPLNAMADSLGRHRAVRRGRQPAAPALDACHDRVPGGGRHRRGAARGRGADRGVDPHLPAHGRGERVHVVRPDDRARSATTRSRSCRSPPAPC